MTDIASEIPGLSTLDGSLALAGVTTIPGTSSILFGIKGKAKAASTVPGTSTVTSAITAKAKAASTVPGTSTIYGSLALAGVTTLSSVSTSTFTVTRVLNSVIATFISQMLDYEEIDSGVTVRQGFRLMLAALAGKTTVAETTAGNGTVTIKDTTGTKNRITATLTNYSRTAMVLDKT